MKKLLLISLLTLSHFILLCAQPNDPLLVVCTMIKNEAAVIRQTLEPFAQAGIDAFIVYDTGSTDNTVEVVKNYFKEKKIKQGYIFQEEFVDFATSRNRALELTHQQFPHAAFIVMPDAEWVINDVPALVNFCKQELLAYPDISVFNKNIPASKQIVAAPTSYLMHIRNPHINLHLQRLIRCNTGTFFSGPIHEFLIPNTEHKVPAHIFFSYHPTDTGKQKSKARWQRDRDILLEEYRKNPCSVHTLLFLGQTYFCLEEWENALRYYRECLQQPNVYPEIAWTCRYKIGCCLDQRMHEDDARTASIQNASHLTQHEQKAYTWAAALDAYLAAYALRPTRAEPLVKIAYHYYRAQHLPLCLLFADAACTIAYPHNDIGDIEKEAYHSHRFILLAISAQSVGAWELGLWATQKALETHPDNEELHALRSFYKKKQSA